MRVNETQHPEGDVQEARRGPDENTLGEVLNMKMCNPKATVLKVPDALFPRSSTTPSEERQCIHGVRWTMGIILKSSNSK